MSRSGSVEGGPRVLLRLEGLAVFAISVAVYSEVAGSWTLFLALFLAPDLGLLGYLMGPRVGAAAYNAVHSYIGPAAFVLIDRFAWPSLLGLGLIWAAHIGFDRILGYGLKYSTSFGHTHLGVVGRADGGVR
jgi:hypothetical protein